MLADKLNKAVALHTQGQVAQAMAIYTEIIRGDPAQPDALHLLGVALIQSQQQQRGAEFIARSLSINPAQPVASANLGNTLLSTGHFETALASFDRSIELHAEYAPAHNGRGSALAALNRHGEAVASFDRALGLQPDFPEALANRAAALQSMSRFAEALADCDRAIAILPRSVQARFIRCSAFLGLERQSDALTELNTLIELSPECVDAVLLRGHVLRRLGRNAAAAADFRQVLEFRPDSSEALLFLGTLEMSQRRFDEAAAAFKRLLEVAPDHHFVRGALLHSQLNIYEWGDYAPAVERILAELDAGGTPEQPFSFLAVSDAPERQLQCAQRLHQKMPLAGRPRPARFAHTRIRLAYISGDFVEHPVAFLLAGMFEAHDRDRFEVTAISLRQDDRSPTARRLSLAFDRFIDASDRSDADIVALIQDLEIDIAVDLMGYTAQDRPQILRSRPAPLQISYIGFPATMGSDHIDYIVADRFAIPAECEAFFTEHIAFLPDCFQANDARRPPGDATVSRSAMGLPESGFVWCSFHTSYKINPPLFDVWARLLNAVPGSVLWLVSATATAEENLRREAVRRGVDPQRIRFAKIAQYPRHLARLRLADLCLDTWPFNGGATTSDALWMGVPVITRAGRSFASRMSGSLLNTVGLPELVTHSFADYERVAIRLASCPEELQAVRTRLGVARAQSPLFDTGRFVRHLESAYAMMWSRHLRGEPPASFAVPR
jgi:protein O-GlcNAc transferase